MAELGLAIAGLGIGAAALAGLLTTCLDCFDRIQDASDFSPDFAILWTRYEAQRLRLVIWSQAVGLAGPLPYNNILNDPHVRAVIGRSLLCIKMLFDNGDDLVKQYGLVHLDDGLSLGQPSTFRQLYGRFRRRVAAAQEQSSFAILTKWSVRDKSKFSVLVENLEKLVDAVENITSSMEFLARRQEILEAEIASIHDEHSLELLRDATSDTAESLSDAASRRVSFLRSMPGAYPQSHSAAGESSSRPTTYLSREDVVSGRAFPHMVPERPGEGAHSGRLPQNQRVMAAVSTGGGPQSQTPSDFPSASSIAHFRKSSGLVKAEDVDHWRNVLPHMSTGNVKIRILRELIGGLDWVSGGVEITTINDNFADLLGLIRGPPKSPYEGGAFYVRLHLTHNYPYRPPICKFLTRIYHPNIDGRGRICSDILGQGWSPTLLLPVLLVSILSMLDDPEPQDPLVPEIAEQCLKDRKEYERVARLYTQRYATGGRPTFAEPETGERPWYVGMRVE